MKQPKSRVPEPKTLILGLTLIIGAGVAAASSKGVAPINSDRGQVALQGYDAVAYFTANRAVGGLKEFEFRWKNTVWRFASAGNRDAFAAEPDRFAPQFGGYCAWAVSRNYTADTNPEAFAVVNGKLYLNYSKRVQRMWQQDTAGNIAKGERNWPGLIAKETK